MKKISLIALFIFVVVSLGSCVKDNDVNDFSSDKILYERISTIEKIETQRIAFDQLSLDEKVEIWQYKLEALVEQNNFNENQINFINKVKKSINHSIYVKKSDEGKIFQTIILKDLYDEGKELFSNEMELFRIFFNLSNLDLNERWQQQKGCICSIGSFYTCARVTNWLTGDLEYGNCSGNKCVESQSGCGGLWASECDGATCTF